MQSGRRGGVRLHARFLALVLLVAAVAALGAAAWRSFVRADAQPAPGNGAALASASASAMPTPQPSASASASPAFPSARRIARALAWAKARSGKVGVAIVDSRGDLHVSDAYRQFQSASLSKAMLLVAYLRSHPRPTTAMRATLSGMIEESDNADADAVYDVVDNSGLLRVAKLAGMQDFGVGGSWIDARVTAADQARFFYRYQSYLPARSVALARRLLSGVTYMQRWGIPAAADPAGWKVFFKGGWLGEDNYLMNQAAWLERGGVRWSLAILTDDDPTSSYGWQTQKGIAGILLGHRPTAAYLAVVHEGDASASQ